MRSKYEDLLQRLFPVAGRTSNIDIREFQHFEKDPLKQAIRRFAAKHNLRVGIMITDKKLKNPVLMVAFKRRLRQPDGLPAIRTKVGA